MLRFYFRNSVLVGLGLGMVNVKPKMIPSGDSSHSRVQLRLLSHEIEQEAHPHEKIIFKVPVKVPF